MLFIFDAKAYLKAHFTWCGNMLIWCESTFKLMRVLTSEEVDNDNYYKNGSHYRASKVVPLSFQKQNREEGETE